MVKMTFAYQNFLEWMQYLLTLSSHHVFEDIFATGYHLLCQITNVDLFLKNKSNGLIF